MLLFTILVFKEQVKCRFFLHKAACRNFSCRSQTVHLATFQKKKTPAVLHHIPIPSIAHQMQQCCGRTPSGLCTYHILLLHAALGWQRAQRPSSQLRRGRSFLPGDKCLHGEGNRVNAGRCVQEVQLLLSHCKHSTSITQHYTHISVSTAINMIAQKTRPEIPSFMPCWRCGWIFTPAEFCSSAAAGDDDW